MIKLINRHPAAYLATCVIAGAAIRLYCAGGSLEKWINPLWIPFLN